MCVKKNPKGEIEFKEFFNLKLFIQEFESYIDLGERENWVLKQKDFRKVVKRFSYDFEAELSDRTLDNLFRLIDLDGGLIR